VPSFECRGVMSTPILIFINAHFRFLYYGEKSTRDREREWYYYLSERLVMFRNKRIEGGFMLVLLVDDDPEDREIFGEVIRGLDRDIKCIMTKDGEEALDYLNGGAILLPDIVFMDINMPRMDGKKCLHAIRSNSAFDKITIVIYSTTQSLTEIQELKQMGAFFLRKASTYKELIQSLVKIFDETREKGL
jgi:CheY-like chemotaxis protein